MIDINDRHSQRAWKPYLVAASIAILLVIGVLLIHRSSPRTLISFHGLLHASVAEGFADGTRATIPPENPFFAGEPLCYYWFFHAIAGGLARVLDLNVFHALEFVILLSLVGMVLAAIHLSRRLFRSASAGYATVFLILVGTNPFGILLAGVKVARDGMERFQDDPDFLWGVVHPMFSLIRFNDMGGLYGPLLNFFLNITSRPVALASLLLSVLALHRLLGGQARLAKFALAICIALTTSMSPLLGLASVGALSAGLMVLLWQSRSCEQDQQTANPMMPRRIAVIIGTMIMGVLVAYPSFNHLIFGPSESSMRIWLFSSEGLKHALTVGLSIAPLVVLALAGYLKSSGMNRRFFAVLLAAGVALLGMCVLVVLPATNQSNCFHAAVVLLAVPAGSVILKSSTSGAMPKIVPVRCIGLALFFLPSSIVLLASYVNRPDVPVAFDQRYVTRTPGHSDLAELYKWVRDETSAESIFVLNPNPPHVRVCGNSKEFPAMTGRAIFADYPRHYLVQPFPDASFRVALASRAVSGERLNADEAAYLSRLNRPIYLAVFEFEEDRIPGQLRSLYGDPLFQRPGAAIFEWQKRPE